MLGSDKVTELHQCVAPVVVSSGTGCTRIGGGGLGIVAGSVPGITTPERIFEVACRSQIASLLIGLSSLALLY
ncbi:hypothetical protein GCM10009412_22940 [Aeromonas salmonicida subsp. achromogenes]